MQHQKVFAGSTGRMGETLSFTGLGLAVMLLCAPTILFASHSDRPTRQVRSQTPKRNQPDQSQEGVRLSATLVQVPTIVTDRSGKFIADMTSKEFSVSEDGKRREIALFTTQSQNLNIVLVLDTSNSAPDRLKAIQNAAVGFLQEMRVGDRAMAMSFDHDVHQLSGFTTNMEEAAEAIRDTESGFGKLLYDAVAQALTQLRDIEGRKAVILFTDGVDMKSIDATAEDTIKTAEEIGATIYVVRLETRWWAESQARRLAANTRESKVPFEVDGRIPLPPEYGGPDPTPTGIPAPPRPRIEIGTPEMPPVTFPDQRPGRPPRGMPPPPRDEITDVLDKLYGEADTYLTDLTTRTGGLVFTPEDVDATRDAFARVAEELRNQYMLGYYTEAARSDGKFHKIKVESPRKAVVIRARKGFRLGQ
jgi:VWFA-related protein